MRRPSKLVLAACYLVPAAGLDALVVHDLGRSYNYFNAVPMVLVSAPAGFVVLGAFEHAVPFNDRGAPVWFALLLLSQCLNVFLLWGLIRGVKALGRAVSWVIWAGNPPGSGEAGCMTGVRQ